MARAVLPSTWENGFKAPTTGTPWVWENEDEETKGDPNAYISPPSKDLITSSVHNTLGISVLRTWPTLYDGTNNPHGVPPWWKPAKEVDVLICGAGPSGLQVALSLARQNVSFRIIDKADAPLPAGRADGVQPRFLETLATWGLSKEVHEEGPLIERTAIYKDGEKLLFMRSHQSDSRYRGLHIITQGQIERIYIRDLARHRALVERNSLLKEYTVDNTDSHPVRATIRNEKTGQEESIRAKFLVGSDGAASSIRRQLQIPFDGVSTGIYWGIMDCIFESDYPHAWVFGSVISSAHGGCVIIPREDGYIRLYTQLDISATGPISVSRQAADPSFAESGGQVDVHSITPDEVLEQANRIFAPYKLRFAEPLSWFAVWKISERVARQYSSEDMRAHLVGDAAHVHSVMGAFGLNASILDSANLAWKLGLVAQNKAKLEMLLPTYGAERRAHAVRIIETSGTYLRFVCGSDLQVPNLRDAENVSHSGSNGNATGNGETESSANLVSYGEKRSAETNREEDLQFLADFFKANGQFLLGVDCQYDTSVVSPALPGYKKDLLDAPLRVKNGVRAPNIRVCFSDEETGYIYDKLAGPPKFHLILFLSSFTGQGVRRQATSFAQGMHQFYNRFGGPARFNIVVIVKCMPFEFEERKHAPELEPLWNKATVLFDDRAPDEDAHTAWGAHHGKGGVAIVRPDLWVGMTAFPSETQKIATYFDSFLLPEQSAK
ncbi:FAD binding domain-containing protein [Biscogniauxia marginata]|nr:FAD binding domain-containing protein [Biscogniauxia marginata]